MVPFETMGTVSYSDSIVTIDLSYTISEIKRVQVENRDFFILPAVNALSGRYLRNIATPFGMEKKLEWCG